ncbi:hypothetical protein ACQP1O_34085 [Nocardia sp. CA-151230]|uniref:hypothetical protein n=1 Tax=Nocardia sp. CA-151230 TaxID=3239982 RepID=UPI003D8CC3E4
MPERFPMGRYRESGAGPLSFVWSAHGRCDLESLPFFAARPIALNLGYVEGLLSAERADALVGALAETLRDAVQVTESAAAH